MFLIDSAPANIIEQLRINTRKTLYLRSPISTPQYSRMDGVSNEGCHTLIVLFRCAILHTPIYTLPENILTYLIQSIYPQ